MDDLKNRQFAIISYLRSTVRGLQSIYEDVLSGKVDQFCLEKCAKCKRILRATTGKKPVPQKRVRSQFDTNVKSRLNINPDPEVPSSLFEPALGQESPML